MLGELLCFSSAMSPSSPCRNHHWLPLLQITEQGLVQTTNRSVVAVGASEATKIFNVIFQHILVSHPYFHHRTLSHLLSKHLLISSSAFPSSRWNSCCWGVSPAALMEWKQWARWTSLCQKPASQEFPLMSWKRTAFWRSLGLQEGEAAKLALVIYSGFLKW